MHSAWRGLVLLAITATGLGIWWYYDHRAAPVTVSCPAPGPPSGGPTDLWGDDDLCRDFEPQLAVFFLNELPRFGISCTRVKDQQRRPKLLTGHAQGATNETLVKIDGYVYRFDATSPASAFLKEKEKSKWVEWKQLELPGGDTRMLKRWVSKLEFKPEKVVVTQEVSLVRQEHSRLFDTVRVKYVLQNIDTKDHTVSLRFLLDTRIGDNQGVPFEVGPPEGVRPGPIVDTLAVYENLKVPRYLRVFEDPADPAGRNTTIAVVGLDPHINKSESLSKVVLCSPQDREGWEWDYKPINFDPEHLDSCVVLYWNSMAVVPRGQRVCAFTYGLDRFAVE